MQIKEECDKFGKSTNLKNTVVYGGVPKGPQIKDLGYAFLALFFILFDNIFSFLETELRLLLPLLGD
jgi:hypothetical protein